ncbi:MAG TPA: adenosylcobalamin-dependent ribonucleoside-diphosphate reductase [Bacteroidales bacterium]|jgi:ribonucleoside-diphosphate reductase alpha chain|nr:adenosylcobalamin-dependent ribonucleoside-diphosphate reductase [Bacteroidales bacterium]HOB26795.1 adenosylcobalamin-dependent ribonucleoside-diphosphate reductase [Bacteroidales bacterium]HPU46697.1 adenosylcobalamin-dependent ribonucleoside-diphosphate reductase [Bacteroidales bacterium]HPZ35587.1 adenosylcobalamin-dependent ribonucleoside-diphosphate reductase [Bacteroidales bacterium]HQD34214.1 adenosylcobalamin-dependent ribonucleoside-diphosphate reductase [Bacteroidales bacterium]
MSKNVNENKKITYEEAIARSIEYFHGDQLAATVWVNKYAIKDSEGNIYELTPDDMHWRLANELARIEKNYPNPLTADLIYSLLKDFKYIIPQGGPMAGIGNNFQISSLSNCFVIGNQCDSYGGIMKTDEEQVQLMKRRGGVGHDLSHIRPKGSPVKNTALTSTGVVPFMERFSNSTREVAQDGRRGALMLTISIKHPDAEDFINAKADLSKVTGANISIKIDDEFMRCVIEGKPYIQQFPIDSPTPKVTKSIDARKLWQKIIHNAWKSAEPGVIFWDTVLRESVPDSYADLGFQTTSTNPCGEIPLCPYDSCRLLAINLYSYVINPFTKKAYFDFDLFKEHAAYAQRIMDDILDLELENIDKIIAKIDSDPEPFDIKRTERELWVKIKDKAIQGRRTGIGITGEGDMLAALGLQYGSDVAIDFSEEVHKTLALNVYKSSVRLAIDRGAFPIFDFEKEKNNPFINRLFAIDPELEEEMKKHGRRNISMLTIAPTGSVSILTQTTSGIEPVFSIFYKRRRKVNPNDKTVKISFVDELGDAWEEYNVFHPKFLTWLEINGYSINDIISNFSDDKINELIQQSPYYHATSKDVDWVAKVRMQGRIQKYVDHSISVTINLPEKVEENLIDTLYRTAWESGCKGVTVYREGSRSGVLVSANNEKNEFGETHAPKRPKKLEADVIRFVNEDEEWIAVVGLYNNRPYEIFTGKAEHLYIPKDITKGFVIKEKDATMEHARYDFVFYDKDGYEVIIRGLSRTFDPEFWNYAKLISGILRHGMPLLKVIDLVDNLKFDNESINTWKKGVNRALKRYVPDGTRVSESCPQCGAEDSLQYKEGCVVCSNCGYSKCG